MGGEWANADDEFVTLEPSNDDDDDDGAGEIELVDLRAGDGDDAGGTSIGATSGGTGERGRWKPLAAAMAFAIATCYADRSNISVAIVAMKDQYEWTKTQQGLVLSAFFYGYGATQIVGGRLADARGGLAVLLGGVCAWSAATALTPGAAGLGLAPLIIMRILLGAGEGVAFPATHAVIAREVPVAKRSTAVAAVTAASYAGAAFAFAVTPGLVSEFGWSSAFYSFGAIALFWIPIWLAMQASDSNEQSKGDESRRLMSTDASVSEATSMEIWRELVSRKEVKAICVAQFTQSWGMYGLLSWLPTYFNEAHGVDIADLPAFTFVPYILQGVLGMGVGILADDLINVKNVPVKTVRRVAQCTGTVGPAIALLVAASPAATHDPILAAVSVDIGLALSALTLAGVSVSHLDIAPQHAGMVFATGNTMATLAGIIAVPLSGLVLDASDQNWSLVFAIIAVIYVFGAVYWFFNLGDEPLTLKTDP